MPALLLFLNSLKLWHFLALGAIILIGGLLGYSWTIKTRLESCAARSEAFIAKVESAASKQIALNAEETVKRNTITRNLENENVKLQNDVASKYADYRRLLKSSSR